MDGITFLPTLSGELQPEHEYLYGALPSHGYQQAIRNAISGRKESIPTLC